MKDLRTREPSSADPKPRPRRPRLASGTRDQVENKYRTLFEKIQVGLYWTSPGGEILDLNPAMAQMLGCAARDEALGKNARDFYLDPLVREHSTELLHKDNVLRNFEFQLRRADGSVIWAQDNVRIVFDDHGRVAYYEGSILDITSKKQEEERLEKGASQVIQHQAALLELAGLNLWDLEPVFPAITEIAAGTLNVERVGVWLFNAACTEIACRDLFQRSLRRHGRGQTLRARDYPRYFGALKESCVISADDVLQDPRTGELLEGYLRPEGITSMMDIPVRRNGRVIGILCHEHIGPPRSWTLEEQHFAGSVGDIVALAVEASERQRMEKINAAILEISASANAEETLDGVFGSIHRAISGIIPAQNFYIALYDAPKNTLSFPYFVDQCDTAPAPKPPGRGLTEYVLRSGKPLLASPEVFARLRELGEVDDIGAPSIDWLGVPLIVDGEPIGVMVVQTYTEGVRYGEEEKSILKFVCDQISMAVHRKKAEGELKRREAFLAASLREKEVLLREVHHRVKNNMQVISSLLNLQSRRVQDPGVQEMFRESQRRIRSMALIHERLYQSSDLSRIEFSQYLRNLASHLFHSYQVSSSRVRLRLDTEEVFININTAIPCGLIVNELISNALKHAFPDGRTGEVAVELHRAPGDAYVISVSDDGVGYPRGLDFRNTETLGMQIVNTLVGQIDGTVDYSGDRGTAFAIRFEEIRHRPRA
jgi:PAS domain S-box-containing protein